ncbi:alpha-galactosidase [Puccinia sorghi]|uniref:Alpha-galactosidase n=1 Tax=Puccinia sorghi TaxID=27349 RepID=A0A0L6V025_9BASI|nr:alpha-galactosidase [Puccinia sorghi]
MSKAYQAILIALLAFPGVFAYDNGLAITPPMGWNTWNKFGCSINEDLILSYVHRQRRRSNLKDSINWAIHVRSLAYFLIISLNYMSGTRILALRPRNLTSMIAGKRPIVGLTASLWHIPKSEFPSGIKRLSDQIHDLGLKLGLYSDAGTYTCGKQFGSLGFETQDAQAYVRGFLFKKERLKSYLKYDNCYNEGLSGTPNLSATRYRKMRNALNATGQPIVYSLCQWGEDQVWNWGSTIANSWRMSGDITDSFDRPDDRCPCPDSSAPCPLPGFHCSAMNILEKAAGLGQKAGPGGWNDLDMLEVGNGGMSYDEYVTHFSMWALSKSPLILGNDVTKMFVHEDRLPKPSRSSVIKKSSPSTKTRRTALVIEYGKGPVPMGAKETFNYGNLTSLMGQAFALAFINVSPFHISTHALSLSEFFFDDVSMMIVSY